MPLEGRFNPKNTPEIIRVDADGKQSAQRSAEYWKDKKPPFAKMLQTYADQYDELIQTAEGELVVVSDNRVVPKTFSSVEDAYNYVEGVSQDQDKLIHRVVRSGIPTTHVYERSVPEVIAYDQMTEGSFSSKGIIFKTEPKPMAVIEGGRQAFEEMKRKMAENRGKTDKRNDDQPPQT